MAVECTLVESKSLDMVRMEFMCGEKKVEFMINMGKDTVRTILGELVQNYSKLFGESPSAEAVGEWTENLRTFFPIRVGRFLVYKTITQGEKKSRNVH